MRPTTPFPKSDHRLAGSGLPRPSPLLPGTRPAKHPVTLPPVYQPQALVTARQGKPPQPPIRPPLQAKVVPPVQVANRVRVVQRASVGSTTAFHKQTGLPVGESDSGGIGSLVSKLSNPKNIVEFARAMSSAPRVKRHNTSAWITGRINPKAYARIYVDISKIRSQHSLDGNAVANTAKRSTDMKAWLSSNLDQTQLSVEKLNELAKSTGSIKVGVHGGRYITLDGVGRLEALRDAIASTPGAKLKRVEVYAVTLTHDEYTQLKATSDYFRDDQGQQRPYPVHDLYKISGVPRFLVGTAMNLFKQRIAPSIPGLTQETIDRRIPLSKEDPSM